MASVIGGQEALRLPEKPCCCDGGGGACCCRARGALGGGASHMGGVGVLISFGLCGRSVGLGKSQFDVAGEAQT